MPELPRQVTLRVQYPLVECDSHINARLALYHADFEPWGQWIARWILWHIAILCITSFKIRVLPKEHTTRAVMYGVLLWFTLLSGFKQWGSTEIADSVGSAPMALHLFCAFNLFYINVTETTRIWWPSPNAKRLLWLGYGSVLVRMLCMLYIPSLAVRGGLLRHPTFVRVTGQAPACGRYHGRI